ncbi:MAG: hypothetical protein ACE149_01650 [Armatimonadota bacterium]
MTSAGPKPRPPIRDLNATSGQVDTAGQDLGDTVDLFVWAGHSWLAGGGKKGKPGYDPGAGPVWDRDQGGCLHMISQHIPFPGKPACVNPGCPDPEWGRDCGNINHVECRWGENDNEVVIVVTCEWHRSLSSPELFASIENARR